MRRTRPSCTYDDTVGARNGIGRALGARADANDGDGAAGESEEDVQVAEADAETTENGGANRRAGLRNVQLRFNQYEGRVSYVECRIHTGIVLSQQAVVGVLGGALPPPLRATLAGVATARIGRARTAREAKREENILCEIC